ncbi:MAG TPA: DHH family phosphoesterase [Thermoleophilaceae bacterium]|nr:DHH family phosphoesterase [Thermoleophilaceae bacterium]
MQPRPTRWVCEPYDVAVAERLAAGLGVSRPVGAVLARRGFTRVEDARRFLAAEERHDPLTLPGVPQACELILRHLQRGSRIAVFGDYDVDGVCSTAILVRALRALGGDPGWELPSRFDEGYGLSTAAVERLAARGADLLVTVDCGITAVEQVAAAKAAGLDVVVTDHHRPGAVLPECVVVHPALGGRSAGAGSGGVGADAGRVGSPSARAEVASPAYGCPELCASGVVHKLAEALHAAAGGDPRAADEDLDLAALATVCDLVPLRGENRRIVREGLVALGRTRKPGLRALMAVAGVAPAELTEHALGFRLGPRINAAGRMRRADAALELLLTEDGARADEVARELDLLNSDRQEAETRILFAADAACLPQASQAAIVVAGEAWHPGVVGIVASRLVERWRRPCVAIALEDDSGRGSGRSISSYDLHAGLAACASHLSRFGGHRMAAGVELGADAVAPFRRALAAHAGEVLSPADLIPVERVDAVVPGGVLGLELAEELEALRPFGMGNPQPTLLVPAARFQHVTGMGEEGEHARFTLVTAGGARSRGVAFGSPPKVLAPASADNHDIALRLERNRWNGMVEPRVILRALCPTKPGELRVLGEDGSFWERLERAMRGPDGAALDEEKVSAAAPATRMAPEAPGAAAPIGGAGLAAPVDRRGEGFAGVAGDLFTSGAAVLVAVADVPRRRRGLEEIVAGLASDGMAVASWPAIAADPRLVGSFDHLVALDPPPGGRADRLLRAGPRAHLAWGPAESEFALLVYRASLDLRPALTEAYRALRALRDDAGVENVEAALTGGGRYPRTPETCARLLTVLVELDLVELDLSGRTCRLREGNRGDLTTSSAYRACQERLAAIERALEAELPRAGALAA